MANAFETYLNEGNFWTGSAAAWSSSHGLNMKVAFEKYKKFLSNNVQMNQFLNHPEVKRLAEIANKYNYRLVSIPFIPMRWGWKQEPPFVILESTENANGMPKPQIVMRPSNWDLDWKGKHLSFMMTLDFKGELGYNDMFWFARASNRTLSLMEELNQFDFSKLPRKVYDYKDPDPGI
jgi:hypothetical protein